MQPQQSERKSSDESSDNAKKDVHQHPVTSALHYLSRKPPANQSDDNPSNESHVPHLPVFAVSGWVPVASLLERALPNVNPAAYTGSR